MDSAIEKAVDLVGGQVAMAEICDVTRQAVFKWVRKGRAPAEHCLTIEQAVGNQITRYQLRPDIFGEPFEVRRSA